MTISVEGGAVDSESRTTDADGGDVFNMTWDTTSAEAKVKVSAAGITADADCSPR